MMIGDVHDDGDDIRNSPARECVCLCGRDRAYAINTLGHMMFRNVTALFFPLSNLILPSFFVNMKTA